VTAADAAALAAAIAPGEAVGLPFVFDGSGTVVLGGALPLKGLLGNGGDCGVDRMAMSPLKSLELLTISI
jgi:hypothetical protein